MKPEDLVVTDLHGKIIEGHLRPSSDLATHIALYKAFPEIGVVSHTHSEYATAWAQARKAIPCLGTTQADPSHKIFQPDKATRSAYDQLYLLYRELYFALGQPNNSPLGKILPELIRISESVNRGKTVSH